MRCVVFVLATLALVGCQDAMQPAQPATSLPLEQGGPGSYEIVNLGTLDRTNGGGGGGSRAVAVNSRGQVVGSSRTGVGEPQPWGVRHAFLWENGVMTDLGSLGELSEATAINDLGQVVGRYVTSAFQERAFIWQNGVMQDLGVVNGAYAINHNGQVMTWRGLWQDGVLRDLGTLGGVGTRARGLSSDGRVVGESQTVTGELHAFLWTDGVMQDLGTLGGNSSAAYAISETGDVTGESSDAGGQQHAFLWRDGVMRDLGLLPGYSASQGVVINPQGDIAGQTSNPSTTGEHAFFWSDGAMHDLGTLGGPSTIVQALSGRGQVAGRSLRSSSVSSAHAFVWEDGMLQDLGTLPGWEYSEASAMNANGDVVGTSQQYTDGDLYRAVLWRRVGSPAVQLAGTR